MSKKIKYDSIKIYMWDATSTAPKDKDGRPIKREEYNVKFNRCLNYNNR